MTAWRLDRWHVSTKPRRKHAKQLLIHSVFTTGCSWGRPQVLLNISLNLKRQPVTSFILDLFLSPVWVVLPSLCCAQRLIKCCLQLWKRWAARAGILGWTSMSERSYFFYHPQTFYYTDFTQRIILIVVCKQVIFPMDVYIYLQEKWWEGIFKLNVKISTGEVLKDI